MSDSNLQNNLLLSGDFAKLCGISKSTLHYYVSINLISPVKVTDNNYKYYAFTQSSTVHLIMILQKAGCSLSEIRSYLKGQATTAQFRELLAEKEKTLIQMRTELDRTINMLQYLHYFSQFRASELNSPVFFTLPENVGIYKTSFATPVPYNSIEYAEGMRKHIKMCDCNPKIVKFPLGRIMKERNFYMENYQYSSLFSFSSSVFDTQSSFSKGEYVLCTSNNAEIPNAYHKMLDFISKSKKTVTGTAFELSIAVPCDQENTSNSAILIFIPVN